MIALETHWTLGFIIGAPLWIIALITLGVLIFAGFHWDEPKMAWTGIIGLVIAIAIIVSPLGDYYKAEYHQWRDVSGKVTQISKRLIAEDKSMSERYVLVINGQPYGVDDTRASLVKVGDTVSLSCKRDWQYASVPGWVCRWNQ